MNPIRIGICFFVGSTVFAAIIFPKVATSLPVVCNEAQKEYEKAKKKAEQGYNKLMAAAIEKYTYALKNILDKHVTSLDSDAINVIAKEIEELSKDPPLFRELSRGLSPISTVIPGIWKVSYLNGTVRTYQISRSGDVYFVEAERKGQILRRGGELLLCLERRKIERMTFAENRLFVEHFYPDSRLLNNKPSQLAVGKLSNN